MREVKDRRVRVQAAQEPRQRIEVVVLDQEGARPSPVARDRLGHARVGFQVAAPGLVPSLVQVLEATATDHVVLEHPEHLVADLAVIGVIRLGWKRHGNDV